MYLDTMQYVDNQEVVCAFACLATSLLCYRLSADALFAFASCQPAMCSLLANSYKQVGSCFFLT